MSKDLKTSLYIMVMMYTSPVTIPHRIPSQERWIYMPQGRLLRQDDTTTYSLKVSGSKKLDQQMFAALTAEEGGPLAAGALPSVKAASEQGSRAVMQALDDDKTTVIKPKKPKPAKATEEQVVPKTALQPGPQKKTFWHWWPQDQDPVYCM